MIKELVSNRKARFNYSILETWEAGIVLLGSEVKSLRDGQGQLQDAYAEIIAGELWLKQCNIALWKTAAWTNHEPERPRKLLMKKSEINKIERLMDRKGLTLIPLKCFVNERGKIKVTLGLAEGKQAPDKKKALKERQANRELARLRKGHQD